MSKYNRKVAIVLFCTNIAMQVHADSSNFAAGVGKKEAYEQVIEQATALFDGQRNWVCIPNIKKI